MVELNIDLISEKGPYWKLLQNIVVILYIFIIFSNKVVNVETNGNAKFKKKTPSIYEVPS